MAIRTADRGQKPAGLLGRLKLPMLLLLLLLLLASLACGVKSGERRPARPQGQSGEFHRSPVTTIEQVRIDLTKTDEGCQAEPADLEFSKSSRIRLAIQLPTEGIQQGATGSLEVTGERTQATYKVDGLQIRNSAGAFGSGVTEVDLTLTSGSRQNFDFNPANSGTFDILCDGVMAGEFTVNE